MGAILNEYRALVCPCGNMVSRSTGPGEVIPTTWSAAFLQSGISL